MIASTTTLVTNVLVSAAEHGGEEVIRAQHNDYLVGICTFVFLVVCLMITLSFNRDR